tara:strand:- start:6535 stop:6999 length:465 start_codon:yes stop_codon:yes gene_type:complete
MGLLNQRNLFSETCQTRVSIIKNNPPTPDAGVTITAASHMFKFYFCRFGRVIHSGASGGRTHSIGQSQCPWSTGIAYRALPIVFYFVITVFIAPVIRLTILYGAGCIFGLKNFAATMTAISADFIILQNLLGLPIGGNIFKGLLFSLKFLWIKL